MERFTFPMGGNWDAPAVRAAVRVLFLLAGVSYYKTTAAPLIDLGDHPTTQAERAFLTGFYVHGLGEFAYRNGIDLRGTAVTGPDASPAPPVPYEPDPGRPLIPFGGGIDSIVTVESLRGDLPRGGALHRPPSRRPFRRHRGRGRRDGVARDAHRARDRPPGPPFRRAGFPQRARAGHGRDHRRRHRGRCPRRHDAVVLSNEWSASVPTLMDDGHPVNHQWSKGEDFERGLRRTRCAPRSAPASPCSPTCGRARSCGSRSDSHGSPVTTRLSQLQPRLPPGPGPTPRPLVRSVRQVLLHRPRPRSLHGPDRPRRSVRRRRAARESRQRSHAPRVGRGWDPTPGPSNAWATATNVEPPHCSPRLGTTGRAAWSSAGWPANWPVPESTQRLSPQACSSPAAPTTSRIAMHQPISWPALADASVGVWGLGVEGRASIRRLSAMGCVPVLVDDQPGDTLPGRARGAHHPDGRSRCAAPLRRRHQESWDQPLPRRGRTTRVGRGGRPRRSRPVHG